MPTPKDRLDQLFGGQTIKEKLFGKKVVDPFEEKFTQQANNIIEKVASGNQLELQELMLLPPDLQKDLTDSYQRNDGTLPRILSATMDTERARRRIKKNLERDQVKLDRTTSIRELSNAFYELKKEERAKEEDQLTETERSRRRETRRRNLKENRVKLIDEFATGRNMNIEQELDRFEEEGSYNYEDAYLHFAAKSNHVENLSLPDFFKSNHPSRFFRESIPFVGSFLGMNRLSELSDKIEALDAAAPDELNSPEYTDMIRDVALYLDAMDSDKTFFYKVADAFAQMSDYMITRGTGRASQQWAIKNLLPRIQRATKVATSSGFRQKVKKVTDTLTEEAVLQMNPLGRGLETRETIERHKVRGQELLAIEIGTGDDGVKYLKELNFKDRDETYSAFLSTFGSGFIEGLTERLGGAFDFIKVSKDKKGIIGQILNGALFKSFKKKNPNVDNGFLLEVIEKSNLNGILPEIAEERVADIAIGALGIDQVGMEIRPGFQLFNDESKEWETSVSELIIPSLEDLMVEVVTIAGTGGIVRYAASTNDKPLPPMTMKSEVIEKGSDKFVREAVQAGKTKEGKPRGIKVNDTLLAVTNRRLEKNNLKPIKYNRVGPVSPNFLKAAKERGVKSLLPELMEWYSNPSNKELAEFASTWYGERFDETLNLLAETNFPELKDQNQRDFFTFLVGITSPSQAPEPNLKNAINEFMIDKGFPSDTKTSGVVTNQINVFKKIADHKGGFSAAMDFLQTRMTGKELRKELFEMGIGDFKRNARSGKLTGSLPAGLTIGETFYAAEMFGPKVGAFTLNLSGVSDIPTIDLWMLRTVSSHLGIPFDNKSLAQVNAYAKRKLEKGETDADWLAPLNLVRADFRDNGNRKRVKAYREVITEVQQEFNKQTGENYTVADIQALIWYMEKSIFTEAGTEGSKVNLSDYLTVAEEMVNSGRVFNERTQRSIRTTEELASEQRAEEKLSRDNQESSEEQVQEETGTATKKTTDKEPDGERPSGDNGTKDVDQAPESRPSLFTKQVPQVFELGPEEVPSFYDALVRHRETHEDGYETNLKDISDYQNPYYEDDAETIYVEPTIIMSEDGDAGAALLLKTRTPEARPEGEPETEIEITSVFGNHDGVTRDEAIRAAIIKAQKMGADQITTEVFDGGDVAFLETYGFVEVGRENWDDTKAPPDWREQFHKKEFPDTNGKPQIVRMEHNPKKAREDKNHPYVAKLGMEGSLEFREESLYGMVTRYISNKLEPLRRLRQDIEKEKGPLRSQEDFESQGRRAYNIAIGKFERTIDWADDFIDRMAKDGFSLDMLDEYLHAKHAKERNALGRVRNKDVEAIAGYNKKGELMTDKQADAILKKYKDTIIDSYANEFRNNVVLRNIQVRLQGGLITEEQARIYSGDAPIKPGKKPEDNISFKNYVPLNIEIEDDGQVGGMFSKMGVKNGGLQGPETHRIKGTDAEVARKSIFQMGMENLLMGMTRAETNQTNIKLLKVIRAMDVFVNKNGEKVPLFEVKEVDRNLRKNYDSTGNPLYIYSSQLADNQMLMKDEGIEYIITINDANMVKAFQSSSVFDQSMTLRILSGLNNFRKQFMTTFSLRFTFTNVQSDLQSSFLNLGVTDGAKLAARTMSLIPKANINLWGTVFQKRKDRTDTEMKRYYDEMIAYGGKISFFDFDGFVDKYRDLGQKMEAMSGKARKRNLLQVAGDYIKGVNEVFEQQTRLATYVAARQEGYPPEKAALLARDVTIDFNKKGEANKLMESAYAFSQVGVNNIYKVGRMAKNNPKKSTALGTSLMALGYYMASVADDHDEEEKEKLSDFHTDHYFYFPNFIFENAEGDKRGFIPLRMPYGWGMFSGMGAMLYDMHKEYENLSEGDELALGHWISRAANILSSNFMPLSGPPTFPAQVARNIAENKDGIGRTIKPYKPDPANSDFELQYPNTPPYLRDLARALANLPVVVGGKGLEPNGETDQYGRISYNDGGTMDMSPEELEYFLGEFFGGVFTSFNRFATMADDRSQPTNYNRMLSKAYEGIDPKRWPFLDKVWQYAPSVDVRNKRLQEISQRGKDNLLSVTERKAFMENLNSMYKDGMIDYNEYNKLFDKIIESQGKLLAAPKSLRKAVKENVTETTGGSDIKLRGVRTIGPKPKKISKRTDLPGALEMMEDELKRRRSDDKR
tara:strand:+ start:805 stop:7299 length:6495 start_codon:yes stop_codon:yes gene_type:complete